MFSLVLKAELSATQFYIMLHSQTMCERLNCFRKTQAAWLFVSF